MESAAGVEKPIEILSSFKKWVYPPLEEMKSFILGKKEVPGYYYNYGERAFSTEWRNQVEEYVIPLLKSTPESKRAIIVFYNPQKDSYLHKKETPGMIMMSFVLRKNKLHATAIIRSNEMFFGWPGNIYQLYLVQDYICKKINCPPGKLATVSVSAHFFNEQLEDIQKVISMRR
ncbi:hypothetical protein A3K73_06210 [Candidatus Pacearchaeota archaeon RBG_13_36_9]|nr:MAG: hypothetical protein A3K73_06210 [Candidatus Pacearchaeota archaeon RBG_13_36_9]